MKKNWYRSKTVWGLLMALAGFLLEIEELLAAGLALAGYGFRDALN